MTYFAGYALETGSAVMVTGSHNPPDYNGLKMVINGETLHGEAIQGLFETIRSGATSDTAIRESVVSRALPEVSGAHGDDRSAIYEQLRGILRSEDIAGRYQDRVAGDHPEAIRLARPMRIAIDAGNGIAGAFAPALFRALGCEGIELFCEVDGTFPNHHPDPAHPENLQDLIRVVQSENAEVGLAFDGDGDRLGVVTRPGPVPDTHLTRPHKKEVYKRRAAGLVQKRPRQYTTRHRQNNAQRRIFLLLQQ